MVIAKTFPYEHNSMWATFWLYWVQYMVFGSSAMFDFSVLLIKKWVTLLNIYPLCFCRHQRTLFFHIS